MALQISVSDVLHEIHQPWVIPAGIVVHLVVVDFHKIVMFFDPISKIYGEASNIRQMLPSLRVQRVVVVEFPQALMLRRRLVVRWESWEAVGIVVQYVP